ncbi:hypothetical protein [Rubritalea tangerina]|uniref:hypothetical protein n=1 Tax=Rubritalea tangerina TaxID=430798 RepID=UPI00360D1B03
MGDIQEFGHVSVWRKSVVSFIWGLRVGFVEIECLQDDITLAMVTYPVRYYCVSAGSMYRFIFKCGDLSTTSWPVGE